MPLSIILSKDFREDKTIVWKPGTLYGYREVKDELSRMH
jgi:hypothetical protein